MAAMLRFRITSFIFIYNRDDASCAPTSFIFFKVLWCPLKLPPSFLPLSFFLHSVDGHSGVNESIVPEGGGWLCGEDYLSVLSCGIQFLLAYEPVSQLNH